MQHSASKRSSSLEYDYCPELTSSDVEHALCALKINPKRTISSVHETSNVVPKQECDCCRLLRTRPPSRLLLPLARRGRPHIPNRSHRLFCPNCTEIKRQQQLDLLQTEENSPSDHTYQAVTNFDVLSTELMAFNNHQYQSSQMLVWKINPSDENTVDLSYDTDSLTANEKKILLDDLIKKLRLILNNRPTIDDQNNFKFIYRTLQTTINILSSSHNSI